MSREYLQADRALPGRHGVIADVDHAAGPRFRRQQANDTGAHVMADPRPQAVQADEIGRRNRCGLGASRKLREIGFYELDVVDPRGAGEAGADRDMGGVVVDRDDLPSRVRRGDEKGADADAAAQFKIAGIVARLGQLGRDIAQQAGQGDAVRRLLDVEALDIGYIGDVAAAP